jgi:hypothetical protein
VFRRLRAWRRRLLKLSRRFRGERQSSAVSSKPDTGQPPTRIFPFHRVGRRKIALQPRPVVPVFFGVGLLLPQNPWPAISGNSLAVVWRLRPALSAIQANLLLPVSFLRTYFERPCRRAVAWVACGAIPRPTRRPQPTSAMENAAVPRCVAFAEEAHRIDSASLPALRLDEALPAMRVQKRNRPVWMQPRKTFFENVRRTRLPVRI